MKNSISYSLSILLLVACGTSEKEKLSYELLSVLEDISQDKIEQAKIKYEQFHTRINSHPNPETRRKMRQEISESNLEEVHDIAIHFYEFSESFSTLYQYDKEYSQDELISRFTASFDSISNLGEENNTKPFNYKESEIIKDLPLAISRMRFEVAVHEIDAMDNIANTKISMYMDDVFPDWTSDTLFLWDDTYVKIKTTTKK